MNAISFTVYARPQPQGSTRAFIPKGWKRPVITSDNKNVKSFRREVTLAAVELTKGEIVFPRPVGVNLHVRFYFLRPPSAKKRKHHTVKPDVDKLIRSVSDSLTGVLFDDDSQIAHVDAAKVYGHPERAEICVQQVDDVASAGLFERSA